MSKKILLINPWIYDFAAYDFWLKPLGLLYLGSLLRQNSHQVHFIDCLDPYHPAMQDAGKKPQRGDPAVDGGLGDFPGYPDGQRCQNNQHNGGQTANNHRQK